MAQKETKEKAEKKRDEHIHASLAASIIRSEAASIPAESMRRIMAQLDLATFRETHERKEKLEKQTVVLMFDPEGTFADCELPVWTMKIIKGNDPRDIIAQLQKAIDIYNGSKNGRLQPATCLADAIEGIPKNIFQDQFLWVEGKAPCSMVILSGKELNFDGIDQSGAAAL